MKSPIKQGAKCLMNDGSTKYVILVHRPGNGFGVSVSDKTPAEIAWDKGTIKDLSYYPWHMFRRIIKKIDDEGRTDNP